MRALAMALPVLLAACSYPQLEDDSPEPSDAATSVDGDAVGFSLCGSGTRVSTLSTGSMPRAPSIAMDDAGDAVVVWIDALFVMASRYTAATDEWTGSQIIGADPAAAGPQIAMNRRGDIVAVWTDGWRGQVLANRVSVAGSWHFPDVLEVDADNAIGRGTEIALAENGDAIAVWTVDAPGRRAIWTRRFVAATERWEEAVSISGESATAPEIGIDAAGNATVAWIEETSQDVARISTTRFDAASGTWGGAALIDAPAGSIHSLRLAMEPSGDAMAIWEQDLAILASHYLAGEGRWLQVETLDTAGPFQRTPAVAASAGQTISIWSRMQESTSSLWASRTVGGIWQEAEQIAATEPGLINEPLAAIDEEARLGVIWIHWGTSGPFVEHAVHTASTGWSSSAVTGGPNSALATSEPGIAAGRGAAIAVWQASSSDGSAICAAPLWQPTRRPL